MTEEPDKKLKPIAGGWITERTGQPVPGFLKLAYVGFSLFGLVYLFLYREGETGQASRGPLVQEMNRAGELPGTAWFVVVGLLLAGFIALLFRTAFTKVSEEE